MDPIDSAFLAEPWFIEILAPEVILEKQNLKPEFPELVPGFPDNLEIVIWLDLQLLKFLLPVGKRSLVFYVMMWQ